MKIGDSRYARAAYISFAKINRYEYQYQEVIGLVFHHLDPITYDMELIFHSKHCFIKS